MSEMELDQLRTHSEWRTVLEAYETQHARLAIAGLPTDGWLPRLWEAPGVPRERLPRIHGKLIALEFLRFELTGPTDGVRYQLSPSGKEALDRLRSEDAAGVPDNSDLAQSA